MLALEPGEYVDLNNLVTLFRWPETTLWLPLSLQYRTFRYHTVFRITPQGDQQLARQRDDANAPHAFPVIGKAAIKPLAQGAIRLPAQP